MLPVRNVCEMSAPRGRQLVTKSSCVMLIPLSILAFVLTWSKNLWPQIISHYLDDHTISILALLFRPEYSIYIYIYICIYGERYIYREREIERERDAHILCMYVYIYIYIYICEDRSFATSQTETIRMSKPEESSWNTTRKHKHNIRSENMSCVFPLNITIVV